MKLESSMTVWETCFVTVQEMTEFADEGMRMMVSDQKSFFSKKPEIKFKKSRLCPSCQ